MTEKLADEMFDAQTKFLIAESKVESYLLQTVLGLSMAFKDFPFDDWGWDHYDFSFELKNCKPEFDMTPEQLKMMWDIGFLKCWLCYGESREADGYSEKFYRRD